MQYCKMRKALKQLKMRSQRRSGGVVMDAPNKIQINYSVKIILREKLPIRKAGTPEDSRVVNLKYLGGICNEF